MLRPVFKTTLAALAIWAALPAAGALAGPDTARQPASKELRYTDMLVKESRSSEACEKVAGRIFVVHKFGTDCVATFVTRGYESRRQAVVFLDGDISVEKFQDQAALTKGYDGVKKLMQHWADKLKVRYILVSRLGINGSSGNHGLRRMPRETFAMMAATDILKQRLGLDSVALAGQSGGSTVAASMLTLGRSDVSCAVLGSGAFEIADLEWKHRTSKGFKVTKAALSAAMYDPSVNVAGIKSSPDRRVLILGDRTDTRTPFDQQLRFAEAIRAAGHHARVIPLEGSGENEHGAAQYTLPAAGSCLNKLADEKIAKAIQHRPAKAAAQASAKPAPVAAIKTVSATR